MPISWDTSPGWWRRLWLWPVEGCWNKQTDRRISVGAICRRLLRFVLKHLFVSHVSSFFGKLLLIIDRLMDGWLVGWLVADDSRLHYTAPTDHINICIPRVHFLSIERSASLTLFWRTHHSQSVIINSERVQLILVIFRFIHILLLYWMYVNILAKIDEIFFSANFPSTFVPSGRGSRHIMNL